MQFLEEFCNHQADRKPFVQAILNTAIRSALNQTYVIFVGPGGTGKTQITLLLTALVGKEATVTTSLKALHSDAFEVANLRGKI